MLTALMQEPWGFHPEQVASLTDDQVWFRYLQPAIERAERMKADPPAGNSSAPPAAPRGPTKVSGPPGEPGSPEHKRACLNAYMSVQGLSKERAEAQYARQMEMFASGEW